MGGFVSDVVEIGSLGLIQDPLGIEAQQDAADAAAFASQQAAGAQVGLGREAIVAGEEAAARGQEFLAPFGIVGEQALDQAGFLTDPQAQFDFLQNNPLFDLALQNANQQTQFGAASRGRLSAGDTLQQLSNNVLLSAQPLVNQQSQNIAGLLDFGRGLATTQANVEIGQGSNVANLLTQIGNAQAAGIVGSANALQVGAQAPQQATQQLLSLAGVVGGAAIGNPNLVGAG